jgi:hypothetical protein
LAALGTATAVALGVALEVSEGSARGVSEPPLQADARASAATITVAGRLTPQNATKS